MIKRIASFILSIIIVISTYVPITAFATEASVSQLSSEAAVVMDVTTGQVLFEKQMNQKLYPASITKIMTAIIALEKGNLNDTITMSENSVRSIPRNTSHIALDVGEQLTLEQALYAMLVESANDAANGVAEYIGGGSIDNFVKMMNDKAKEIGAVNTHFVNPHGLHDDNHYTTAYDMALITKAALKNDFFAKISGTVKYTMSPTNKQPEQRFFNNKNYLLNPSYEYKGAYCGKVGYTIQAKNTLVTCAKKNERNLIAVVMKASTLDNCFFDTMKLFDYGFDHFKAVTVPKTEISVPVFNVTDENSKKYDVHAYSENDFSFLLHDTLSANDIIVEYEYPEQKTLEAAKDIKARFILKNESPTMYSVLGEYGLSISTQQVNDNSLTDSANKSKALKPNNILNFVLGFFKYLFLTIIVLFIILLIIRYINLYRRRKRRRLH